MECALAPNRTRFDPVTERPKRRHAAALQMGAQLTRHRLSKEIAAVRPCLTYNQNPAEKGLVWSAAA